MKLLLSFLMSVGLCSMSAWCIEMRTGSDVEIDDVLTETLFAAGSDVVVDAQVDGDVFLAGEKIEINAAVTEDVWLAGESISIEQDMSDDVRVLGNIIDINGVVGGDLMLVGNNIDVRGAVGGDVIIGGNTVSIDAPVVGDVTLAVEVVTINSRIEGNLTFDGRELVFGSGGYVVGDAYLVYPPSMLSGFTEFVGGEIVEKKGMEWELGAPSSWMEGDDTSERGFAFPWISFISLLFVGIVAIWGGHAFVSRKAWIVQHKPIGSFFAGLLTVLFTPLAAIILIITVVGASVGGRILANYFFLFVFMKLFVALFIADIVVRSFLARQSEGSAVQWRVVIFMLASLAVVFIPFWIVCILGLPVIGSIRFDGSEERREMGLEEDVSVGPTPNEEFKL